MVLTKPIYIYSRNVMPSLLSGIYVSKNVVSADWEALLGGQGGLKIRRLVGDHVGTFCVLSKVETMSP